MKFENEVIKVKFELPEPFTLRHVELWEKGRLDAMDKGARTPVSIRWLASLNIMQNWECETLPDMRMKKDLISGDQLRIIAWVGLQIERHVQSLLRVPKV